MNRFEMCLARTLTVVSVALAIACSGGTAPQPTQQASAPAQPAAQSAAQPAAQPSAQPAGASSQPAPSIPAPTGLGSGQYSDDPDLRCDLEEVRRVSGGALLIKWRIVNTTQGKKIHYDFDWPQIYYIDPAENKKYSFLTDSEGKRILDVFYGELPAGQQRANWAKFPAPPPTTTKISVNVPKFPPFEDVPISQ
jgi:hypothetical protein